MAPVVKELERHPDRIDPRVCVTAQHREMLDQVLDLFGIEPDLDLDLMRSSQTLAEITSRILTGMDEVLEAERPAWVLVQGDTTTVMATAIAAFYRRIGVGHVEAGLRTSNRYNPFPEEINRRIAGVVATTHFAPTQTARDALLAEGVAPETVIQTGNPIIDALHWVLAQPKSSTSEQLFEELGLPDPDSKMILVTAHRRESFGPPFESLCRGLRSLVDRNPDVRIVYPVHLNPNVREPVDRLLSNHERIQLIEPLSYEPFAHLMSEASIILTDSGGIQEEAPALGKPVLVMRETTERPEAVEAGVARLVGTDAGRIVEEAERLLHDAEAYADMSRRVNPFGDGQAAERIVQVLMEA